ESGHARRETAVARPLFRTAGNPTDLRHQIVRGRTARHDNPEMEALRRRVAELETLQNQRARSPPNQRSQETGHVYVETDSPLSPEQTLEPLTGKIKVPQIGLYDGTSDPDAHLGNYTSWMDLHGATDALRCRMFSLTLGPKAQKWKFTKAGDNKGKRRTQEIPDDDEGDEGGSTFKRLRAQGDKEIFVIGPTDVGSPQDQHRKRGREADAQPRPSQTPLTSGRSSLIPRVNTNRDTPTSSRRQAKAYTRKAYNSGKQVMTSDLRETINARTCPITFTLEDASLFDPHSDALIITAPICGIPVHRIMVDTGAYTSILMLKAFNKLGIDPAEVRPCNDRVHGFNGSVALPLGEITLPIRFGGNGQTSKVIMETLKVMDLDNEYNAIIGRTTLYKLRAA
ncbi:Unknown protein, partial [Striga hermonthica]